MKDELERFVCAEVAEKIRAESKERFAVIKDYLRACEKVEGYVDFKICYEGDDFINNRVTVRVYYKDYYNYTDKKF